MCVCVRVCKHHPHSIRSGALIVQWRAAALCNLLQELRPTPSDSLESIFGPSVWMCVRRDGPPNLEGGGSRAGCARGQGNVEAPRELPAGTATEQGGGGLKKKKTALGGFL